MKTALLRALLHLTKVMSWSNFAGKWVHNVGVLPPRLVLGTHPWTLWVPPHSLPFRCSKNWKIKLKKNKTSSYPGIKSHFSKSKKVELSLGVVVGGGSGTRHPPPPPPPPPQTLTRKISKSKKSSWSLGVVVGGGGGVWCQTPSQPPPPPQTLTRKLSKSKRLS